MVTKDGLMTTRRGVLRSGMALAAMSVGRGGGILWGEAGAAQNDLIPLDFIGLGYEMSSVGRTDLLSGKNAVYVQLIRNLGARGVLRIGGIVADFTSYAANGPGAAEPKHTVITRESLEQLRGMLDATEWAAIWSVNFGSGSLEDATVEVRDVAQVLGPRLMAIELGNEVENYARGQKPLRTSPYSYETFRAEHTRWRAALLKAVPDLRFAAPDTAASVEWVERMAQDARGDVQLLTTHYYRGDQRQGTQEQLLRPDAELMKRLTRLREASKKSGIPWRMCETNSFFGGGRPGVSNTMAGALWTLEFMLLLATHGCAGVNIETGVNQLGFVSSYSPIQDDGKGHNSVGVPYYGMLAFAEAVRDAREVHGDAAMVGDELSVYVLGEPGRAMSVTVINKSDSAKQYEMGRHGLRHPMALRLMGPSLASETGITLGGATVDERGRWAGRPESVGVSEITVAAGSAVVVRGM